MFKRSSLDNSLLIRRADLKTMAQNHIKSQWFEYCGAVQRNGNLQMLSRRKVDLKSTFVDWAKLCDLLEEIVRGLGMTKEPTS